MDSILAHCMREMNKEQSIEQIRNYPSFGLLLIMQWTFAHGHLPYRRKTELPVEEFRYLVNLWHHMADLVKMPNEYEHTGLFIRNLAFQQLWLQGPQTKRDYIRQYVLFRRNESNHYFNALFREKYRIELKHFLDLSLALSIFLLRIEGRPVLTKHWYDSLKPHYPNGTIEAFYLLISGDRYELREIAKNASKGSILKQFYRRTPFRHRPFYRLPNGDCYLLSNPILGYYINNAVYDMLRRPNPQEFMQSFGRVFEDYVFERINEAMLRYWDKSEIQNVCDGLNVDAIFEDGDSLVYLDVKGVEMAALGMVPSASNLIADKLKTSVLKGIKQGYASNEAIKVSSGEYSDKEPFLLIVTFKELFLGSGSTFEETVGYDFLSEVNAETDPEYQIPSENMFFMDIQEFERLLLVIKGGNHTLLEILLHAREQNRDSQTSKFMFTMHLDAYADSIAESTLNVIFDKEVERIGDMLR
jgi:hypothetical protein